MISTVLRKSVEGDTMTIKKSMTRRQRIVEGCIVKNSSDLKDKGVEQGIVLSYPPNYSFPSYLLKVPESAPSALYDLPS